MIITRFRCDFCLLVSGPYDPSAPSALPTGWGAGMTWDGKHFEHLCVACMAMVTGEGDE